MKTITAAQKRLLENAVLIAATRLLFDALRRQFSCPQLAEIVTIHNGQGLRASEREEVGRYTVYAAGGPAGRHSALLSGRPFVVIGRKGSAGKLTFAPSGGWVIDTAYYAQPKDEDLLNCEFLFHAISSLDFSDDIISTAIPGINRTSIYRHTIPLPPRHLQDVCVSFLNAAATNQLADLPPLPPLLDKQRQIVARIEQLAAKIDDARNMRQWAARNAGGFIAALHLSLAGARRLKLSQFLELHEVEQRIEIGKSYPQVGVKGFGEGLFAKAPVEAAQTTYRAFNRLYKGAVVLSQVKGWEGAIAVCPSDLEGKYLSPEYRTFRCIPSEAVPEYLAGLFATPWYWSQLSDLTRGVGARRERIRPDFFLNMEIPMPRIGDQQRALPLFERVQALKRLQAETAAELDALMPSILDRAFRGEL